MKETEQELRVGDVVTLKSGGPKMTITRLGDEADSWPVCSWFSEGGQYGREQFPRVCLVRVRAIAN
jgi:uncharacterized protein YodC (DUF2158 family)